jgi:hypothetical protein
VKVEDIHDQFCVALTKAGAEPCEALIPDRQATRADAVFTAEQVVVEVKSVTVDRNKVDEIRKKSGQIWSNAMKHGASIPFGTVSLPFDEMGKGLAEELLKHLGDRVRKELRSANKQIRATVAALGLADAMGIVVLAVPAHFSLHAGFIATVAGRVLRPDKYRSIHGLIICGVPVDGQAISNPLTFTFHPRTVSHAFTDLPGRIGQAWIKHLSEVDGVPITQEAGSPNQFEDIFLVGDEDWPKLGEAWQEESGDA